MIAGPVRFFSIALSFFVIAFTIAANSSRANDEEEAFFEARIRPILASSCIECHGPKKASGGLRLDSKAGIV